VRRLALIFFKKRNRGGGRPWVISKGRRHAVWCSGLFRFFLLKAEQKMFQLFCNDMFSKSSISHFLSWPRTTGHDHCRRGQKIRRGGLYVFPEKVCSRRKSRFTKKFKFDYSHLIKRYIWCHLHFIETRRAKLTFGNFFNGYIFDTKFCPCLKWILSENKIVGWCIDPNAPTLWLHEASHTVAMSSQQMLLLLDIKNIISRNEHEQT